jgi:hypothetical protein
MNERDPLEETLARFRETLPPATVCDSNRAAVRAALEPLDATFWWRRSITLPLPVVLSAAAALLVSLAIHLLPAGRNAGPPQPGLPVEPPGKGDNSGTTLIATADPQVEYFETQRYLSGIGVIDRDVLYQFQE